MANRIQIKRSLTSGNVPNATDLLVGEFAVNIPDKKIFTKDGAEQVVKLTVTDYSELTGTPTLGTAAAKDVPTTGDAATTEVVLGSDTRLTDARTPTAHNQAWSTITDTPTTASGYGITDVAPSSHVGSTGGAHGDATTTVSGFMSAVDKTKLNGVEAGANAYVHPTTDGNLHVPATGTTNDGKFLKAGATAGSLSWQVLDKATVGLSNVDNTSDDDKPVSTATQTALNTKQDVLYSGTNIKTINGESVLGAGDLAISGSSSTLTIDNKTSAYTVVASDLGKIINCTSGSFTLSLTAAATLGAGFNCWIWNTSITAVDSITIVPNASETIDGRAMLVLSRGEGLQIVCDGTNWRSGAKKAMWAYAENYSTNGTKPTASGNHSFVIGDNATASASSTFAIGDNASATGTYAIAVGTGTASTSSNATAIGRNSGNTGSQAVIGSGAMALGGSYASGNDSFAAAVANNTGTYGARGPNSVAIGLNSKADGLYSTTIGSTYNSSTGTLSSVFGGSFNTASGERCSVLGGTSSLASGSYSTSLGGSNNVASGSYSTSLGGSNNVASGSYSYASGHYAVAAQYGKQAFASGRFEASGDAQSGKMVLRRQVQSAATTWTLFSDNAIGGGYVTLPDDSTYAFRALVVARDTASDASKAWEVKGAVRRGAGASTISLIGTPVIDVLASDGVAWGVTVTVNTTQGALIINASGEDGKTINFVATVWTTEVSV